MSNKTSENSCFLIPLHPPDYKYLDNLEQIVTYCNVPVYIVLTSCDIETELKYPKLNYLYFDQIFSGEISNWPTQKKLYGTKYLYENTSYKYIIVCDAEIKLENVFNQSVINKICYEFYKNKKFYGGGNSDDAFQQINQKCMHFANADNFFIQKYKSIYFWFSEFPIYERNYFNQFFTELDLYNRSYQFDHYDFLLYAYWLVIHYDFDIIDWNNLEFNQKYKLNCSGELISSNKFISFLESKKIHIHWLSSNKT